MFEEGNAFTMEAVQQQLDDLAAKHEAQVGLKLIETEKQYTTTETGRGITDIRKHSPFLRGSHRRQRKRSDGRKLVHGSHPHPAVVAYLLTILSYRL